MRSPESPGRHLVTDRAADRLTGGETDARVADVLANPPRRYNPLVDEWVLVSTERTRRPWLGRQDPSPRRPDVTYDPTCYLCPKNTRANGLVNPAYERTFLFVICGPRDRRGQASATALGELADDLMSPSSYDIGLVVGGNGPLDAPRTSFSVARGVPIPDVVRGGAVQIEWTTPESLFELAELEISPELFSTAVQ